jgi:hypothetical protein
MTPPDTGASYRPASASAYPRRTPLRRHLPYFIMTIILVMLALPPCGAAKPGYEVHTGDITLVLPVQQTAQYVVSVSANEQQRVQFVVEGPSSRTEYSTKGRVSDQHIVATFGSLGQLDVNLHFTRHSSDAPHKERCRGRGTYYQEGTYRGTLEFSQSENIPAVSHTHGRVYFEHRFRQVCKRQRRRSQPSGRTKPKHRLEVGYLKTDGKGGGRTVFLEALSFALRRNQARSVGRLAVIAYERDAGVRIARRIDVAVDGHSFAASVRGKTPETIEIEPPTPFSGSALYSHSPGMPPSWTGDLTVDLSNTESIPLTGPDFSAVFCRSSTLTSLEHCPYANSFTSSVGTSLQSANFTLGRRVRRQQY